MCPQPQLGMPWAWASEVRACVVQALRDLGSSAPLEYLMSQAAAMRDSGHSVVTFSPKVLQVSCSVRLCCLHTSGYVLREKMPL